MKNLLFFLTMISFFLGCFSDRNEITWNATEPSSVEEMTLAEENLKEFLESPSGQDFIKDQLQERKFSAGECNCSYKINRFEFKNNHNSYVWNLLSGGQACMDDCNYFHALGHSQDCTPPPNTSCIDFEPTFGEFYNFHCPINKYSSIPLIHSAIPLDNNCIGISDLSSIEIQIKCCSKPKGDGSDPCVQQDCLYSEEVTIQLDGNTNSHVFDLNLEGCGCEPVIIL